MKRKEIKGVQEISSSKCYIPDESLVEFIQDWLHIHKKRDELAKEGKELSDSEKQKIRALDRMKVHKLDNIIFPSMANLIYFFEAIGSSKRLADAFEDELVELLNPGSARSAAKMSGSGMRFTSMQFRRNNFARLILSVLEIPKKEDPTNDFRISLMYQILNIVGDNMEQILLQKYSHSQVWKSAIEDYNRMKGWLALLAGNTEDFTEEPTRKTGFLPIWLSNKASVSKMEF